MQYVILAFVVLGIGILLKLHWIAGIVLGMATLLLFQRYKYNRRYIRKQENRFFEASEYMDAALYNFLREQKIEKTYENLCVILQPSPLRNVISRALDHMKLTFDETEVYKAGLDMVEKEYHCDKIQGIHEFMYQVERYGGAIESSCQILLEDKNCWEARIRQAMADRKRMFRQVILSVIASLIICGIILYMPIRGMNIVTNPLVQIVAVIVVILDELIILAGQKYLKTDWLQIELNKRESGSADKMRRWRSFDSGKERRLSLILGIVGAVVSALMYLAGGLGLGFFGLTLTLLVCNQHLWGRRLLERNIKKEIACEFPRWLMEVVLLMQSENVQVAMYKSAEHAPDILKHDITSMNERLEIEAEDSGPYHDFLKDFQIPEVHSAMIMLYSIAMGHSFRGEEQLQELIRRNLYMMDDAQKNNLKDKGAGLYLLFLAPVLTASVKLLVDMFVVMFAFITNIAV